MIFSCAFSCILSISICTWVILRVHSWRDLFWLVCVNSRGGGSYCRRKKLKKFLAAEPKGVCIYVCAVYGEAKKFFFWTPSRNELCNVLFIILTPEGSDEKRFVCQTLLFRPLHGPNLPIAGLFFKFIYSETKYSRILISILMQICSIESVPKKVKYL